MIDTHAHLDFSDYKKDFVHVLERAFNNNINGIISVGIDEHSSRKAVDIAEQNPKIWATVGVHPHDSVRVSKHYLHLLKELSASSRVLAIGETGLDYYRDRSPRDIQQKIFREQIRLAIEIDKPVIIHCRDAYEDTLKIVAEERIERVGGILHCFSGDLIFARKSINLGLYISFAGTVTYPNAQRLREVVKEIPPERILIETDSPFLTPQSFRGKRNEPFFIGETYETVASVRNITTEELRKQCRLNLHRLTGLVLS